MPNIIVKKNLIIFRKSGDWISIYAKILKDYGRGMMVRTRLRRELGFTYRRHDEWVTFYSTDGESRRYCEHQIHLDFYSTEALSWFQLKYLNL